MATVLPPIVAGLLIILGVVFLLIGNLWTLVVAAQRSVLWLLAVLLIPLAAFVLLFVEPKSRPPFFLAVLGLVMAVGGTMFSDTQTLKEGNALEQWLGKWKGEAVVEDKTPETAAATPAPNEPTLEQRKDLMKKWQAALQAKQAALKPGDAAAKAEFDQDLKKYLAALEKLKADMAAQPNQP